MSTSQVHVNIYPGQGIARVLLGNQEIWTLDLSNPQAIAPSSFAYFSGQAFGNRLLDINQISVSYFGDMDEIALMQDTTSGRLQITEGNIGAFQQQTNDTIKSIFYGLQELLPLGSTCPIIFTRPIGEG